jgi:Cathepsin propeptide inhibitor domain (I29)
VQGGSDPEYDAFTATHGRRHASRLEYELRRSVYSENRRYVEAHNAAANGPSAHRLALNRFADWTDVRGQGSPGRGLGFWVQQGLGA